MFHIFYLAEYSKVSTFFGTLGISDTGAATRFFFFFFFLLDVHDDNTPTPLCKFRLIFFRSEKIDEATPPPPPPQLNDFFRTYRGILPPLTRRP